MSLSCLFETIEIVKNIDGEKSQQYFSGFTLNQDHVVNTLTQEVTQIISRELNLYLRQYLTDLENVKRYAEFRKNNENKGFGNSMLTNFMGGVALTVNPLIGLGLLAKGAYDYYQNDQNETNQIEQFNSLKEKFFVSIDKLSECENTVSSNVASFIKEKIITAFNELGTAINQYCNDNNFSIDYICDAIYQNRISDNFNGDEAATFLYAVLMNYMLAQENLYPGTREFFQRELQRLS